MTRDVDRSYIDSLQIISRSIINLLMRKRKLANHFFDLEFGLLENLHYSHALTIALSALR